MPSLGDLSTCTVGKSYILVGENMVKNSQKCPQVCFKKAGHELESMSRFFETNLDNYSCDVQSLNSIVVVFALKINICFDFLVMSHIFETLVFVS